MMSPVTIPCGHVQKFRVYYGIGAIPTSFLVDPEGQRTQTCSIVQFLPDSRSGNCSKLFIADSSTITLFQELLKVPGNAIKIKYGAHSLRTCSSRSYRHKGDMICK